MSRATMRARWRSWAVGAALVAAGGVILALAQDVRALRPMADQFHRMRTSPFEGQWLPTTRTLTVQGDTVVLGETARGRSQVLLFFTTTCPYCLETLPVWKRISADLRADADGRYDIRWVSLSDEASTASYLVEQSVTEDAALMPDRKTSYVFRVFGVPTTVVLDYRGRIALVRSGALARADAVDTILATARRVADAAVVDSLPLLQRGVSPVAR